MKDFLLKINTVTKKIIVINCLIYILALIFPILVKIFMYYSPNSDEFTIYGLVTSQYIHGSLFHLFGNMLGLYFIGDMIEKRLGKSRFFLFYTITGIIGCLISSLFVDNPGIGASGCVFGLVGSLLYFYPNEKFLLYFIIPVKVYWVVPLLFTYELMSALIGGDNVGHYVHLFSGLSGFALSYLSYRK